MAEKQVITTMVIKVDLACEKCHKKIKKVLCKISQIQNQIYDKKTNTVTCTVLCCCPEKIKKKICCKGGETVKCIEIIKPKEKEPAKEKDPSKEKGPPKEEQPKDKVIKVHVQPPTHPVLVPVYCSGCYRGIGGGSCHHCCGTPMNPCFEPRRRLVYDNWDGDCSCRGKGYYVCRCEYVYENNPPPCTIM